MKKVATLAFLFVSALSLESIAHYIQFNQYGWTRLLLAAPIVYAGVNFHRAGAVAISMMLLIAQGPLIVHNYVKFSKINEDQVLVVIAVAVFSMMFGNLLRKEKENSESLEYIGRLIQSMRQSVDERDLLAALETVFSEKSKSSEVATYMYGEDGCLRLRQQPDSEPLPEGHLFYAVAEKRDFMASANPQQDSRFSYYGPENERSNIAQLAVYPIVYGGRPRGVIAIANSADSRFEKETAAFLNAIKQSVESTLELWEKRRDKIRHETQGKRIRVAFSSYLSSAVAEEILKAPDRLELGGEIRDVTVMFAEVANFKELMKTEKPADLLRRLNEYFSSSIDAILEFDGAVDKFIGDNIMAFWGAPLAMPDCESKAVACAARLHEKAAALNKKWEEAGLKPFIVRLGINSGPAVAGNVGSARRMEYTVMGDTVNVAARIKSLAVSMDIPALASDATRAKAGDAFEFKDGFNASIKGKTRAITVRPIIIKN